MRTPSLLLSLLLLPVVSTAARAQTPNNLIGLTRATPLLNQRDHTACAQLPFCAPPGFPPAPAQPFAGGTGWDPMREGAIISNGFLIAEVDPNTCAYICPPAPAPLLSPNAVVTGLEVVESLNQVWILDSLGVLYQANYACPPGPVVFCNTGLAQIGNLATGGLAVDECNRLVFCSYSDWVTGVSTIHISTLAMPCAIFQIVTPPPCAGPLRGITGLAVDGCRQVLYITDGVQTIAWSYNVLPGPVVAFGLQSCCFLPPPLPAVGDTFIGLAVRSGRATSNGVACANGVCPPCPMVHTLGGSPNLGNATFSLDLNGAPFNSLAWCGIGLGPCAGLAPVVPPLCGPVYIGPLLQMLGFAVTPPGIGCGASVSFGLPLPVNPAFCGLVVSSQCVALCASGTFTGWSLSNCLSWELQSN